MAEQKIDREKVCPLLLRVFIQLDEHHRASDFDKVESLKNDEIQIYTWKDATLFELTRLIKGVHKSAAQPTAKLDFAFVYPDREGRLKLRHVGTTFSSRRSNDDRTTLQSLHFQTGDYLDVAIM